jgi:hypothetical protein
MINRATLVWMVLAISAGIGLFVLKYDVKSMEEELVRVNQQTLRNLEAVHVLKAEWSYLNQPARLEDLGRRLLSLEPIDAEQAATIADIPLRPVTAINSPNITNDAGDAQDAIGKLSPAAGQVPPILATHRRAQ